MKRLHLMEIEDLPWLPNFLRDAATGFLLVSHKIGKLNQHFVPILTSLMEKTKHRQIIDLGSGAGGPMPLIVSDMLDNGMAVSATLTDLYPPQHRVTQVNQSGEAHLRYELESVDATNVPKRLPGIRTMICSFHHLDNETASKTLLNAQTQHQPIAIFEAFDRNLLGFLFLLPSFIMPLFLVPLIRPFRMKLVR